MNRRRIRKRVKGQSVSFGPLTLFYYQIFRSDNIDKAILDALLPVAFAVAPIFKAKK